MHDFVRLSGAILILLVIARAASKTAAQYLPLGGSEIAQMAIVFGAGFAASEIVSMLGNF